MLEKNIYVKFNNSIINKIKSLNSKDIIILSNRTEAYFLKDPIDSKQPIKDKEYVDLLLKKWVLNVDKFAKILNNEKIYLVIFAPTPIFRDSQDVITYDLCTQEWFRSYNAIPKGCKTKQNRKELILRKKPIMKALKKLEKDNKNVFIYDPFEILCPESNKECSIFLDNKQIMYDDDHISSLGAELIYPSFNNFLLNNGLI